MQKDLLLGNRARQPVRAFKDDPDHWQDTPYHFPDDLPELELAVR